MEKPCGLRICPGLGAPKLLDILALLGYKELGTDLGQRAEEPGGRGTLA